MNKTLWNKSTKQVFTGQLLTCILGILAGVIGIFTAASAASSFISGDSAGAGGAVVVNIIVKIAIICGFVLVFLGIKGMKDASDGEIQKGVQNLWIATILNLIGSILGLIPVLGIVGGICNLVALVFLIIGFSNLKNSVAMAEFSAPAAAGFKTLFTAEIINIIGTVVAWIPIIGVIGSIACFVALIMVLVGWKKVSTPVAE